MEMDRSALQLLPVAEAIQLAAGALSFPTVMSTAESRCGVFYDSGAI